MIRLKFMVQGLTCKVILYLLRTIELSACKDSDFKGRFIIKKSAHILTDFQINFSSPKGF
ncbi:hypothetical protein ACM46_11475 [Chryseobacterium angstadtii]|uniref:Uncharacterized protein n=1 Tax=Chryseobacterium angstadtii TaxID=558151 RepID=A0A0J7IFN3_9FLAO|nr:hypothetical protein ACM46_11475 [Chryseobacterium angstadtii]